MNPESIRLDVRATGDSASCCGVNLAVSALVRVCFFSPSFELCPFKAGEFFRKL
jgi:hypothetical protein